MHVVFTETDLGLAGKQVVATLRDFARSTTKIIGLFDHT
jgi:hypothetical protein